MNNICRKYLFKSAKFSGLAGLALSLSGCIVALPPAVQVASLALDGVSYLTTGKSVTDHAISAVTEQDCAMTRALKGEDICSAEQVEVAARPDGAPAPEPALMAADVSRNIKPGGQDEAFQDKAFLAFSAQRNTGTMDLDEILDLSVIDEQRLDREVASGPML